MAEGPLPLPVIAVTGALAECGAAYGRAAADLIAGNLAVYRRRFATRAGLDAVAVRRAGAGFRAGTRRLQPRIAAMLDGLAEGAGVSVEEVYALNARTELLYGTSPAPGECTAVGVLDSHTADGHTVLAQNWDWHPAQRPYTLLLATRDERGHAIATLAEAGMLAKTGLNSAGLGLCVNMLSCDRDGRPGGLPYHVLLRAALETDSLGAALRAVCNAPRSASVNLLLGQAGPPPGGGELIDLELVPGDLGVRHPVDGILAHANHLESPVPVHDRRKDDAGSSWYRSARADRLLRRATAGLAGADGGAAGSGRVGRDHLVALLADHGGYPYGICRHVDERDDEDERSESIFSVVLDLDERRLSLAPGPPCGGGYVDRTLDQLLC
jgi:isopenicillin-N N-acyltransferase-like protein